MLLHLRSAFQTPENRLSTRTKSSHRVAAFAALLGCLCLSPAALAQPHPYASAQALAQPRPFAPGVVSTEAIEYGPAFTPDGKTLYFTRRASWRDNPALYVTCFVDGAWQAPQVVAFSGTYSDEYPSLSPDGNRLYFASKRPVDGGETRDDNDLWFVERSPDGWGAPQHLAPPINGEHIDSHPHVTEDGTLYFHSGRSGGAGGVDIYRADFREGRFAEPTPLPFNSEATDGEAVVDPRGRFIIFYSERAGGRGKGDLFIVHNRDGVWSSARNLGDAVNTDEYEWTPALSPDGRYLFYAYLAGNDSDIHQVDLQGLLEPR
jgi:Tol biopolymer transport system component